MAIEPDPGALAHIAEVEQPVVGRLRRCLKLDAVSRRAAKALRLSAAEFGP